MRLALQSCGVLLAFLACLPVAADQQDTTAAPAALPQQNVASTNADPVWRPSAQMRAAVENVTRAYFQAWDANRAEDAYAFLSPGQKQHVPLADFERHLGEFNAKAGALRGRHLRAVTWYKDTPQAGPGLYVAVDYSADFANFALQCGYLVWHEQVDGSFLQVRQEINVIDKDTMSKLDPLAFQKVRAQFRC